MLTTETPCKLVEVKINKSLANDALGVCGGLYSMNARSAFGYLFNPVGNYKKVYSGMFCDRKSEIDLSWTYYFEYATKKFYKIVEVK